MILNDFREKIERNNSELVELLMLKDELTNEQESMLIGKDKQTTTICKADHAFLLLFEMAPLPSPPPIILYHNFTTRRFNYLFANYFTRTSVIHSEILLSYLASPLTTLRVWGGLKKLPFRYWNTPFFHCVCYREFTFFRHWRHLPRHAEAVMWVVER